MANNKHSAKFRYHAMRLAAELILKWLDREDKRTDGQCQIMPQLHGQFFAHFPNNLENSTHWSVYRDVFVFYRLNMLFQQKNEELKRMKKERLEKATEEDKKTLSKALDRLARRKSSGSRSKKKKKVRRRRIKDGVCMCVIVWREAKFVYLLVVLPGYPKVEMSSANAKMAVDGGGPRSSRFIMAQKNLGLMLEIIRKDPESYKEA
ncbi:hypothetical protein WR25_01237 [Diploscapter pachys]|uniref:Uncharacterized protein n=1 Tax=Diploscapter pachys TaxID=2018661 RepID=A0A2A2JX82_9BILA|nr:hypothetical protein WR25_01237 [Diploscapter pachys]